MELMIVETKELVNSELKEDLLILDGLFSSVKGNQKQIAKTVGRIISHELYKDDFEKLTDFLKYISLNKSTATQFKKFSECVDDDLINSDFSYSQIVEMFPLLDIFEFHFLTLYTTEMLDITPSMRCCEIRKLVKDEIIEQNESEETEDAETADAETAEAEAEAETESDESKEVIDYTFYIDYLTSLEVGMELTKDDIKIFKQIARELR